MNNKVFNLRMVLLGIFVLGVTLTLVFRNIGLYPVVADESVYNTLSRLRPFVDSKIPIYLFMQLYHVTNFCGDGFLSCVKIINIIFFVSASFFIYLVARRYCSNSVSLFISILSLISPINIYTAFFMPESFYFFGFWLFTWLFLEHRYSQNISWLLLSGAVLGALSLVKPHAVFMIPVVLIYYCLISFIENSFLIYLKRFLYISCSFFVIKFGVSWIYAGASGLSIFGSFYGGLLDKTDNASLVTKYSRLFFLILENLKGHVASLSILFGLPLIVSIMSIFSIGGKSRILCDRDRLLIYSSITISFLVLVSAAFTSSIVGTDSLETNFRIHMRYYNFSLPLMFIVMASLFNQTVTYKTRLLYSIPILTLIAWAFLSGIYSFIPCYYVDSPELRGISSNPIVFAFVTLVSLTSIFVFVFNYRIGIKFYLFLCLPIFMVLASYYLDKDLSLRSQSNNYDRAVLFVKSYLLPSEFKKMQIITSDNGSMLRSKIFIDDFDVPVLYKPQGSSILYSDVLAEKDFILLVGDFDYRGEYKQMQRADGFSFIQK